MKVVNIKEETEILVGQNLEEKLEKDKFYIMSDSFFEKLKTIANHILGIEIPFRDIYNPYKGQDLNNKKVLALRHGGLGDILFLLTGYNELKRKYPQSHLNLAISSMYVPAIKNNPDIDQIFSLPMKLDDWEAFHYHIIFEGLIENNSLAEKINAYDLFMQVMALNTDEIPSENKIPKLYIDDQEKEEIKIRFPQLNSTKKKVGIQVASSSPIRNYPAHNYIDILKYLEQNNYETYLFGSSNQNVPIEYLHSQFPKSTHIIIGELRDALVISSFMNVFIAPDSAFIHIAGALQIPLIGIYGPFSSSLRMKYFKNAIGIDAKTNCSPCFRHGHSSCPKGDPSPCFSLIKPETIIESFKELEKVGNS